MDNYINDKEIKESFDEINKNFSYDLEQVFGSYLDSLSLKEHLNNLRKKDLVEIRRFLDIPNVSQLNKRELINVLYEKIPVFIKNKISLFSQYNYNFLKRTIEDGEQQFIIVVEEKNNIDMAAFWFFQGVAVPVIVEEGIHLTFTDEVYSVIKDNIFKVKKEIKKNEEILINVKPLLKIYGTIPIRILYQKLQKYIEIDVDYKKFEKIIDINSNFHNPLQYDGHLVSRGTVYKPGKLHYEQTKRNLDYADIPRNEFYKARKSFDLPLNFSQKKLKKFFVSKYNMSGEEAEELVGFITHLIQNGLSTAEIVDILSKNMEMSSMEIIEEVMQFISNINNQTRQWVLKGHIPEEVFKNQVEKNKKG